MCGRFVLAASKEALQKLFKVEILGPFEARYNIAPSQPVLFVGGYDGVRRGDYARWGLIPSWHKDPDNAQLLINARSETVTDKPSFKSAIAHRRVLVPATHFYEWRREGKGVHQVRQPYAVDRTAPDGEQGLFAMAGIVEDLAGKGGEVISTLALLTQQANGAISTIHHRMPLVVPPDYYDSWLDTKSVDPKLALATLRNPAPDAWKLWPVDRIVNRAGVDGAQLLDEAMPAKPQPPTPNPQLDLF
jgi:putative SOS response-associated peptidase YedK